MLLLGQAPRQGRLRRHCVMGCAQPWPGSWSS